MRADPRAVNLKPRGERSPRPSPDAEPNRLRSPEAGGVAFESAKHGKEVSS
jgi:hypothetical protein